MIVEKILNLQKLSSIKHFKKSTLAQFFQEIKKQSYVWNVIIQLMLPNVNGVPALEQMDNKSWTTLQFLRISSWKEWIIMRTCTIIQKILRI